MTKQCSKGEAAGAARLNSHSPGPGSNSGAARPGAWQGPVLFVAASHFARPRRRETTTEYRIFEADQVFRETPESVLGKPIVTVGIASGSRLDVRVGPACRSLTHMGFALAGRF